MSSKMILWFVIILSWNKIIISGPPVEFRRMQVNLEIKREWDKMSVAFKLKRIDFDSWCINIFHTTPLLGFPMTRKELTGCVYFFVSAYVCAYVFKSDSIESVSVLKEIILVWNCTWRLDTDARNGKFIWYCMWTVAQVQKGIVSLYMYIK